MQDFIAVQYAYLIPLLPLFGAAVAGFFGAKWLKGQSHWPIWIGVGCSAVLSLSLLAQMAFAQADGEGLLAVTRHVYWWITAGNFNVDVGYFFDPLTAVMLCVVCGIGFFITVFAAGYMKGEAGYFRFFAYLGLFIFAMTSLVMGSNFVMLYLGWEGVGLCSYLLIGYYYEKPSAVEAAKKAFLVNRIGDFGFGLGIFMIFKYFGTVHYFADPANGVPHGVLEMARAALANPAAYPDQIWALKWIPFLLMLGAFGKSAQFPLYVWLPDAMEGPTPVSALIHAATMVTAGVYMIARCSTLFVSNQAALVTIAVVGSFTALFAATIALRQFDLKKVFAYSTISQLGYMFVGVGVLAPVGAVFHLVTHAFFKALLFLSSGVVMHAMLGHLDMRKMSGLRKVLPKTNILMLVGCLALAGFPLFSGFFSKDEIIDAASKVAGPAGKVLWGVLLLTAFLTAYYTFRLYFQVFQGPLLVPTEHAEGHAGYDDHGDVHGHGAVGHGDAHGGGTPAAGTTHGTSSPTAHAEAGSSHEAVATGTTASSGVDAHLASSAHQAETADAQSEHSHHDHEPNLMIVPLVVLAVGAVLGGLFNVHWEGLGHFLGHSPSFKYGHELAVQRFEASGLPKGFAAGFGQRESEVSANEPLIPVAWLIGAAVSIAGILLAYWLHLKERARAEQLAGALQPLTGLLEGKYFVDQIYQAGVVEPLRQLGVTFFAVDRYVVDGLIAAVGAVPQLSGFTLKFSTQRGYLQGYAAAMLIGLAAILVFVFV